MPLFLSKNVSDTLKLGEEIGAKVKDGTVIAYFGDMGMGKTAFTHGLAKGMGIDEKQVSSPTFALVHEYSSSSRKLYHFDMYRINTWDDLYSTGYFDYMDLNGVLAIEWSENIEFALPEDCLKIIFSKGENENERKIEIIGEI